MQPLKTHLKIRIEIPGEGGKSNTYYTQAHCGNSQASYFTTKRERVTCKTCRKALPPKW